MRFVHATVTQCVVRIDDPAIGIPTVEGRSALWWLLREFSRFGVTDFLLLTGEVPADVQTALPHQVRITLAPALDDAGSGGALFRVRDQLQDRFLLCDSGQLSDWNVATVLAAAAADEADVVGRLGPHGTGTGLFGRELVELLRPVCSLEDEVLPALAERGLLRLTQAHVSAVSWPGAGRLRRKALFLDRDGVLNVDHGYVGSIDRFEWTDGAVDAIRYATDSGWHVFVVTNQSGVARGLYTEDAVRALHGWMADQTRAAGGTIDDARFCPFHPDATLDAYRQTHPWRKPQPGMLLDLIRAWELDPARSVLAGDQETDMQAAAAAGVAGHLFRGGNLFHFLRPILQTYA